MRPPPTRDDPHVLVEEVRLRRRPLLEEPHLRDSSSKGLKLNRQADLPADPCAHLSRIWGHGRMKTKKMRMSLRPTLDREGGACESLYRPRLLLVAAVVGLVDLPVGRPLLSEMALMKRPGITHHQKTPQMTSKMPMLQQGEEEDRREEGVLLHRQDQPAKHRLGHHLAEEGEARMFHTRKSILNLSTMKKATRTTNPRRKRWNSLQVRHDHLDDSHRGVRLPRHHHRKIPDRHQERAREVLFDIPKSIPTMECTNQMKRKKTSPKRHCHQDEERNVPRPLQQLDRHLVEGCHHAEELQRGVSRAATRMSPNLPSVVQVRENQTVKKTKANMSTAKTTTALPAKVAMNMLPAGGRPPNVGSVRLRPVAVPRRSREAVLQKRK